MRFKTALTAFVICCTMGATTHAQELPGSKDFSFKRIKVGKPSAGKRILVQIDPVEQARALAVEPVASVVTEPRGEPAAPAKPAARYDWFWTQVSPTLSASGPGRLPKAVVALSKGPGGATVAAPRLDVVKRIADAHGRDILLATIGTQVSPAFALAVIAVESAGKPDAVSSAGAQGLMQLMPDTAKRFGVEDSTDAAANIKGGVAYLDWLMKEFERDPLMVLAGYNAGENAVKRHEGIPPYNETRDYVPKVLAAWTVARGLCATPPQLISDGCAFSGGS